VRRMRLGGDVRASRREGGGGITKKRLAGGRKPPRGEARVAAMSMDQLVNMLLLGKART